MNLEPLPNCQSQFSICNFCPLAKFQIQSQLGITHHPLPSQFPTTLHFPNSPTHQRNQINPNNPNLQANLGLNPNPTYFCGILYLYQNNLYAYFPNKGQIQNIGGNWRHKHIDIPIFYGDNLDGWLLQAEKYFNFYA